MFCPNLDIKTHNRARELGHQFEENLKGVKLIMCYILCYFKLVLSQNPKENLQKGPIKYYKQRGIACLKKTC
jgi:hypothetical protein